MIAGVLLAAGRSTRFGSDKLCAMLHGESVIRHSIRALEGLDEIVVVVAADGESVRRALSDVRARFVVNAARDTGMASSIRTGVEAVRSADAAVIALGDQPLTSREVTSALVEQWRKSGAQIVVARYRDGRGHPVLFARDCFDALSAVDGDAGARSVIESGVFAVGEVCIDGDVPLDVDTPEALALAAQRATNEASISHLRP